MSDNWTLLEPWPAGEDIAHLRHDLANLLLPLRMGAETLEQTNSGDHLYLALDLLNAGLDRAMTMLEQLTALLEPVKLQPVTTTELAARMGCASKGDKYVRADLESLRVAQGAMPSVSAFTQSAAGLEVAFAPYAPFMKAAGCAEPAKPYQVKGVGLALALSAAVIAGHGGAAEVNARTGSCRWRFPYYDPLS